MQQQNPNPLTEVGVILISFGLIAGGVVLLVLGKIDFTAGTLMFGLAIGLYAGNAALKSPSQAQQAQIAALSGQVLNVLPQVVSAASGVPPPAQTVPTTPVPAQMVQQPAQPASVQTPWQSAPVSQF